MSSSSISPFTDPFADQIYANPGTRPGAVNDDIPYLPASARYIQLMHFVRNSIKNADQQRSNQFPAAMEPALPESICCQDAKYEIGEEVRILSDQMMKAVHIQMNIGSKLPDCPDNDFGNSRAELVGLFRDLPRQIEYDDHPENHCRP